MGERQKKTLCIISCECVCPINIEEKNTPKVTHGWPSARESNSDDLEYVLVCVLELYMIYSLCNSVNLINSTLIFASLPSPKIYLRKSAAHSSKIDHYKTKTTAKKKYQCLSNNKCQHVITTYLLFKKTKHR